jgi:hypothetical protein
MGNKPTVKGTSSVMEGPLVDNIDNIDVSQQKNFNQMNYHEKLRQIDIRLERMIRKIDGMSTSGKHPDMLREIEKVNSNNNFL